MTQNYPTPEKYGAVHIVQEAKFRLVLKTDNENTFYFDVPAQKYVSSLTEIVPTITPIPSPFTTITPVNPYP
jgi:hypothetical protein